MAVKGRTQQSRQPAIVAHQPPIIAGELNNRQRTYLLAAFDLDQRAEENNKYFGAPPAEVWRWMEYGPIGQRRFLGSGELRDQLVRERLVDSGAGATWSRLGSLRLVELKYTPSGFATRGRPISVLWVRMTTRGRRVCRHLRGLPATKPRAPESPFSLTALRLLDFGQRHPDQKFYWRAPWDEVLARIPEAPIALGVAKGLIGRGLLAGKPQGQLTITPAGRDIDVAAQPNWKPFRGAS